MQAVQITAFGGPEVLRLTEVDEPVPDAGELLIDVYSAGVNYADTHQTENSYLAPQTLPLIPGAEVVGRIRGGSRAGQRVLAMLSGGGYAETAVAKSALTYPLDDTLTDAQALALIVQGTTAWHLLRTCTHFSPGETVVIHSAAGGVGSIAVQLARAWGAGRIIGTASGAQKCELVESLGADVAIDLAEAKDADDVKAMLLEANNGKPIDVVLEMTGGHVFDGSLSALRPLGRLAVFGMASRVAPSRIKIPALMATSRSVTGFWLVHALRLPGGLAAPLEELTSMIRAGRLNPIIGGSYPLADAAEAHAELRSRRSIGKLILNVCADPDDPGEAVTGSAETPATSARASTANSSTSTAETTTASKSAPSAERASAASAAAATKSLITGAGAGVITSTSVDSRATPVHDAGSADTDSEHTSSKNSDADKADSDNPDSDNADSDNADSEASGPEEAGPENSGYMAVEKAVREEEEAEKDGEDGESEHPKPESAAADEPDSEPSTPAWEKVPTTKPTAAQLAAVESFGSAS